MRDKRERKGRREKESKESQRGDSGNKVFGEHAQEPELGIPVPVEEPDTSSHPTTRGRAGGKA